ncbi:helix-turn-helix transcriptional regulator [Micromonospora sp. NPDC023633]|uniref:helix-turn-helix domain-containing protein n=1 Tax=Micromonospora sp. NPDC023633 TaxID=3154320 RepID=UPI0033C207E4
MTAMNDNRTWDHERFMAYVYDHAEATLGYRPNATDLATAAGISQPALSRWKSGQTMPSTDHLRRLAEAFNIKLAALYVIVGLLPENESHIPVAPPRVHPLASQINRLLAPDTSRLSRAERAEFTATLRRLMLGFGVAPSDDEPTE